MHWRIFAAFVTVIALGNVMFSGSLAHEAVSHLLAEAGAVGIVVGVQPNPYNVLAGQLHQKEIALNEREAQLNTEATTLESRARAKTNTQELWGGGILFGLVALNFILDYRSRRAADRKNAA